MRFMQIESVLQTINRSEPAKNRFSVALLQRELVYMLLVHLFVYFAQVGFCPFSFPLGVGGWQWLVTVALPGLFYMY